MAAVTERTAAVIPVHYAGQACDLEPLWELGLHVIEDAAPAMETRYHGRKVGGLSDATCFSLNATKNLPAIEGGLVATANGDVAGRVRDLRMIRPTGGAAYDVVVPAYKETLPDVNAAIALCQLAKLEQHRQVRLRHVAAYDTAIAELGGIEPLARSEQLGDVHAHHLYTVRIKETVARWPGGRRTDYQRELAAHGIQTSIRFPPVHQHQRQSAHAARRRAPPAYPTNLGVRGLPANLLTAVASDVKPPVWLRRLVTVGAVEIQGDHPDTVAARLESSRRATASSLRGTEAA